MQRGIEQLSPDLLEHLILNDFTADELASLRYVNRWFRNRMDVLLTKPARVIAILAQLLDYRHHHYPLFHEFVRFYTGTTAYRELIGRTLGRLSILERFCLSRIQSVVLSLTERPPVYFAQRQWTFTPLELLWLLTQLSPVAVYTLLGKQGSYGYHQHRYDPQRELKIYHSPEDSLMALVTALISGPIKSSTVTKLQRLRVTLESHPGMQRNDVVVQCLASLNISLLVMKQDKTEEDWNVIIKGANAYINLMEADLRGAKLDDANLSRANLFEAKLDHASLKGANLRHAYLKRTNFHAANLNEADMRNVNACTANFSHASLVQAKLQRSNLFNTTVARAIFTDANLEGAFLAKNFWTLTLEELSYNPTVSQTQLQSMRFFYYSRIRKGFDYFDHVPYLVPFLRDHGDKKKDIETVLMVIVEQYLREVRKLSNISLALKMLNYAIKSACFLPHYAALPPTLFGGKAHLRLQEERERLTSLLTEDSKTQEDVASMRR